MAHVNRAQFIHGDWNGRERPQRPPWSVEEARFVDLCRGCKQCGDCLSACPEKILISGRGHFPVVDFRQGGCSFCGECVEACPSGAINTKNDQPWLLKATIGDQCVSLKGVECRSCGEACGTTAISFRLVVGGVAKPELSLEDCTGCGECISVCPVNAISVVG